MILVFAVVLVVHGIAHLVGFVGPWRLMDLEGVTFQNALLNGRVPVGPVVMKAVGLVWLAVGLAFVALGIAAGRGWGMWRPAAIALAAASLVLCLIGWPASRIGAAVNVVLLAGLALARSRGWI